MANGRPRLRTIGSSLPSAYGGQPSIGAFLARAMSASFYIWPLGFAAQPQQMLFMPAVGMHCQHSTLMPSQATPCMAGAQLGMSPTPQEHAHYVLFQSQGLQGPGGIEHYGVQRVLDSQQAMHHGVAFPSVATAAPRAVHSQQLHHAPTVHMVLRDQPLTVETSHSQGHKQMADDDHKLSLAYRVLGCLWKSALERSSHGSSRRRCSGRSIRRSGRASA